MNLPPNTAYRVFRPIKRTIRRLPLGYADVQGLPPFGWCGDCGSEIFEMGQELCRRCREARYG